MGKNKKQQEHRKKGKVENEEEDILTEVSEFLGIPVWEVTKADVKKYKRDNGIEDEDEENEEEEEEEENEDEAEDNKEEQIKEEVKEETKDEDTKVKETKVEDNKEEETKKEEVKETTNTKEQTNIDQQNENNESSLKIPKALNNNDTTLSNDVQYPIVTMLTPNITKITTDIDYTDSITYLGDTVPSLPSTFLNEIPSSSSTTSKSHIQFLPVKHIYEYPKEDSKQSAKPIHKKQKTKDNTNDNHINTKQSKKDSKVKSSDDLDEDEMKRLQEIRKRREEFAYLEKIRKEEEEQKRKEREEQKAKEPVKKSYKPKPKKKRK